VLGIVAQRSDDQARGADSSAAGRACRKARGDDRLRARRAAWLRCYLWPSAAWRVPKWPNRCTALEHASAGPCGFLRPSPPHGLVLLEHADQLPAGDTRFGGQSSRSPRLTGWRPRGRRWLGSCRAWRSCTRVRTARSAAAPRRDSEGACRWCSPVHGNRASWQPWRAVVSRTIGRRVRPAVKSGRCLIVPSASTSARGWPRRRASRTRGPSTRLKGVGLERAQAPIQAKLRFEKLASTVIGSPATSSRRSQCNISRFTCPATRAVAVAGRVTEQVA
jgi:hypothetical protein